MACAICKTRRPKRFCPGVGGEICTICCGTEREVTVSCPYDCEYLQDARLHDRPVPLDADQLPHKDVEVTESLLARNEDLVAAVGRTMVVAAENTAGTVDSDVRDALDGLTRTYKTLQSGVYYESRPANPRAAGLFGAVQETITGFREEERKQTGISKTRDSDVLAILVFLQRVELDRNNGRPRGRAFLDAMRRFHWPDGRSEPPASPSLILP